jgi:hypothetical protein
MLSRKREPLPKGVFKAQLTDMKFIYKQEKKTEYVIFDFVAENGAYFSKLIVINAKNEKFSEKEARRDINTVAPNFSNQEAQEFFAEGSFPRKGIFGSWFLLRCDNPDDQYPKIQILNQTEAPATESYTKHHPEPENENDSDGDSFVADEW